MELRPVDVLEERDELRRPLLASLALHAAVFGLIAVLSLTGVGRRQSWGDPNSFGGGRAYGATPVRNIPIAGRGGPVNRVASDTQSEVPTPPKAEPKKAAKEPEPDAIAMKSRKAQRSARSQRDEVARRDVREFGENQVFSRAGQAAASPMYAAAPGSGGVGLASGAPFGARCGGYAAVLRDRLDLLYAEHPRSFSNLLGALLHQVRFPGERPKDALGRLGRAIVAFATWRILTAARLDAGVADPLEAAAEVAWKLGRHLAHSPKVLDRAIEGLARAGGLDPARLLLLAA